MDARDLLDRFCRAVESGDGAAFAALFAPDGVYHDVFYGAFRGRDRIAAMLADRFHRDARDFRWDMRDPVCDGATLYARYVFSFESKLPGAEGKRAMFEGVAIMALAGGLIESYREIADTTPGLVDLGFAPERIARIAVKRAAETRAGAEWARHLARG